MNMEVKDRRPEAQNISVGERQQSNANKTIEFRQSFLTVARPIGDGRYEFASPSGDWTAHMSEASINSTHAQVEHCLMPKIKDRTRGQTRRVTMSVYADVDILQAALFSPNHATILIARRTDVEKAPARIVTSNGVLGHPYQISDRTWQALKLPAACKPEMIERVTRNIDVPPIRMNGGRMIRPPYIFKLGTLMVHVARL